MIPGLLKAYDANPNKEMKGAIETLQKWDYKTSKESKAMTLAHYYGNTYFEKGKRIPGLSSMELMKFWGTDSSDFEKLQMFRFALFQLSQDFGTWQMPWGEVNRYQRLNGAIQQEFDDSKPSIAIGFASGRWGALAAYGARYTSEKAKKIYGTRGNSFVAAVEFGDKVKAKTILAGGQSGDPESPHFGDQIKKYEAIEWKEVPYYKEDVLKKAIKKYKPGE